MNQEALWDGLYSGNGKTTSTLLDMGYEVTGIDFSEKAVEYCRSFFGNAAEFRTASATDLPFDDGSFDYVTCVHVLEHLTDEELETAVSEISRVLLPGGYVFVRSFTADDMRSAKRAEGDIRYIYREPDEMAGFFGNLEVISSEKVEEATRFGTVRSRTECLFAKR